VIGQKPDNSNRAKGNSENNSKDGGSSIRQKAAVLEYCALHDFTQRFVRIASASYAVSYAT
jgi:hypothetical protein